MNPGWRHLLFVVVFGMIFTGLTVSIVLLANGAVGPPNPGQPPATAAEDAALTFGLPFVQVLWFPMLAFQQTLFKGRNLPGNEYLWIFGCGVLYGIGILLAHGASISWHRRRVGE